MTRMRRTIGAATALVTIAFAAVPALAQTHDWTSVGVGGRVDKNGAFKITFAGPTSSKRVAGELFEDGSGVAQIQDVASLDTVYLEGPHDFATDHMRLVVPRQLVDSGLIAGPMTVELKVDGASVEACASTSS